MIENKHNDAPNYDLVALGETMLRFTPEGVERLGYTHALDVHVGGSESNTAVGLARLGNRVAWVSRLTSNALGQSIDRCLRSHGVDTQHVVWTTEDRVGLYFLENGSPPRPSQVIYDRANSAFAKFSPSDLPRELFASERASWLHVTGISLGLGETTRELIAEAVALARAAGWKIGFDVNYRSLLWSREQARYHCDPLMREADLVFMAHRDAEGLWKIGFESQPEKTLGRLDEWREGKPTIMTLASRGAMAAAGGEFVEQRIEPVPPVGRLGGGDAFSAGFYHAWFRGANLPTALKTATAVARLKYSIPGDLPLIDPYEVERLLQQDTLGNQGLVR